MPSKACENSSISLRDLLFFLKGRKKFILGCTLTGICLLIGLALTRPVLYHAKASFVDRGKSNSTFDQAAILLGNKDGDSLVISILKSHRILRKTVQNLGLQAHITPSNGVPFFLRPLYHLRTSLAYFLKTKVPIFEDPLPPFRLRHLSYEGEGMAGLDIFLKEDGTFIAEISSTGQKEEGKEGFSLSIGGIYFTLERTINASEGHFFVSLHPINPTTSDLEKSLKIEESKKNQQLILLECFHPSRATSALVLNTLMREAEKELQSLEKEGSDKQLAILQERQAHSFDNLHHLLQEHADLFSKDFSQLGFIDSEKALAFYIEAKNVLEKRGLELSFEKNSLLDLSKIAHEDREVLASFHNIPQLEGPIKKLRELQGERDGLSLAVLHESSFGDAWSKLESGNQEIRHQLSLLDETGRLEPSPLTFLRSFAEQENIEGCKKNLLHLAHLYEVEASTFKEMPFQWNQDPASFEAVPSHLCFELLLGYQKKLDETEEHLRQISHLLEEFDREKLPLSAIATATPLKFDIEKIVLLEMGLQDPKNRSQKEQDRIRDELSVERAFLKGHLQGHLEIFAIRKGLFQERMSELRKSTLSHLYQEIALLQNEILHGIDEQIERIGEKEALLEAEKESLLAKIAPLPTLWVEEALVKQKTQLHERLFIEITSAAAVKELASQINLVLSAPLDKSTPPILPAESPLILFSLLGGFSGFFLAVGLLFIGINRDGLPATPSTLKELGYASLELVPYRDASSIDTLPDVVLETLRKIPLKQSNLFLGCPSSLPFLLGELFEKIRKERPLFIQLDGTLGHLGDPTIRQEPLFDTLLLPQGRFLIDFLRSDAFKHSLEELKGQYPVVMAYSNQRLDDLAPLFHQTVVSANSAIIDSLSHFSHDTTLFIFI